MDSHIQMYLHIKDEDVDGVSRLIQDGADVNINWSGCSALQIAADQKESERNLQIIRLLIAADAHINDEKNYVCSPLHLAIRSSNFKCAKELLINGADVNGLFGDLTPLYLTHIYNKENKREQECIKLLLKNGGNINHQTSTGTTVLMQFLRFNLDDESKALNISTNENIGIFIQHLALQYVLDTSSEHRNSSDFLRYCLSYLECEIPAVKKFFYRHVEEVIECAGIFLGENFTFFHLLLNRCYPFRAQHPEPEYCIMNVVRHLKMNHYPCLDTLIDDCLNREELLDLLYYTSLPISVRHKKKINMNSAVLAEIGRNLSKEDLLNFVKSLV